MFEKFGAILAGGMFSWLWGIASEEHAVAYKMSVLEITIWICAGKVELRIPQPHHSKKLHWTDPDMLPPAMVCRPTVASVLKLVQIFFGGFLAAFDFGFCTADRLDPTKLGVMSPQKGIQLWSGCNTVKMMGHQLAFSTERRLVRKACDLGRPMR